MTSHYFVPDAPIATAGVDASLLEGRHVLVTGASGAVGIHVVAALRALAEAGSGPTITAVVHTDPPAHLAAVFEHRSCRVIRADLSDSLSRTGLPKIGRAHV